MCRLHFLFLFICLFFLRDAAYCATISPLYAKANEVLTQANKTESASRKAILEANKIRKATNRLRAQSRSAKTEKDQEQLMQKADALATKLARMQRQGAQWRDEKNGLISTAVNMFEEAMVDTWAPKIRNRRPIMMADSQAMFFAHNTKFRSVHPSMLNKMGSPSERINKENIKPDMSILVPALAGQNAPPDLDISSFQLSRKQQVFAHIEVNSDKNAPLNEMHSWLLMLSDLEGKPIAHANIDVVGHMPGHVHGLPTAPRVTKEVSPGIYLVEGLKFQMKGWWVMQFNLLAEGQTVDLDSEADIANVDDSIVFNLVL